MQQGTLRVGIVGLKPRESWAGIAHVPALLSMPEDVAIVGVANSRLESSQAAAAAVGIPHAFAGWKELVAFPDIDIVTVTITVPQHLAVVQAALAAGKHVYCEAPLGNGLAEAQEMAGLAREKGVVAVTGLQARTAPEILYLRTLIAEGYVGEILSSTMTGWGGNWGATISNVSRLGYLLDAKNGATMLTIPVGHTLAALRDVLGDLTELSALLETRVHEVRSDDDGTPLPMTAADQVLVQARLASGAPLSLHYVGGMPKFADGFVWDIHGTRGDIRVTAPFGHAQMAQLSLAGARTGETAMAALAVPERFAEGTMPGPVPGNVARNYARMFRDIRTGSRTASTFDDAVGVQKVIETIRDAAKTGKRIRVDAPNRPLPLPDGQ